MRALMILAAAVATAPVLAAPAGRIGAADIKGEWPLSVPGPVRVLCEPPSRVMIETPDRKVYAITGKARDGVREVDEVWRVIDAKGRRASNLADVANLATSKCRDSGQFKG